jgi:hypothetical protein
MSPNLVILAVIAVLVQPLAHAGQPSDFLVEFAKQATVESPDFKGFDRGRGAKFFNTRHGDWSCSTCHTEDPRTTGKHAVTDKRIEPMAPSVNPERFTDSRKVEKWFKRNCNDVLKRACTAQEKGDVLTYLSSLSN